MFLRYLYAFLPYKTLHIQIESIFLNTKYIREGFKSRLNSRFPSYNPRQNIFIRKRRLKKSTDLILRYSRGRERENKIESVKEQSGKENIRTEEGGEQDSTENCVRRRFKKTFLGNKKEAQMGRTGVKI